MKFSLHSLAWTAVLSVLMTIPAVSADGPNQVLVKLRSSSSGRVARSAVERLHQVLPDATYERVLTADGWHQLTVPEGTSVADALAQLQLSEDVEFAEPNFQYPLIRPVRSEVGSAPASAFSRVGPAAVTDPNDPLYPRLYGMEKIGVSQAWEHTPGSNTVVIAVFDTGIDYTHPDLAANMWRNPGEIPGNRIDDDKNGYVDDVYGANIVTGSGDSMDGHGHGTHVAGTIGAVANNGLGVAGVSQNVQLLAVRIARDYDGAFAANLVQALDYLTALKKRGVNLVAVNHSWGGIWPSRPIVDAMVRLSAEGVIHVCAAGNGRTDHSAFPTFPNEYNRPGILSVAATDAWDHLAGFTDFSIHSVDVASPGVFIWSTLPGNRYAAWAGTSMAAPHVTGAVGLLYSLRPNLTAEQVKYLLMHTVDPLPEFDRDRVRSGGRINVGRAVQWLVEGKPLPSSYSRPEIPKLAMNLVSRRTDGFDANEASSAPSLSGDGRFVAFVSRASNLVPSDTNGVADIFLRDQQEGTMTLVSRTTAGRQADGVNSLPVVSGDGQWVAFVTAARSLVPEDTTNLKDILLWERESGAIQWVSRSEVGETQGNSDVPSIDFAGERVVFQSNVRLVEGDTNSLIDVYLFDRTTAKLQMVSTTMAGEAAENASSAPSISADGRWVAFISASSQMVPNDTNQVADVFVRDLLTGATELISQSTTGEQATLASTRVRISGDGRFVAFQTSATNLDPAPSGTANQIYLRDRQEGRTWRVSKGSEGQGLATPSNLEAISDDGRWVTFRSNSLLLPPGAGLPTQRVFGYDRLTDDVVAWSYSDDGRGAQAIPEFLGVTDVGATDAALSGDGTHVALTAMSGNLAPEDGNPFPDIFVLDRRTRTLDLWVQTGGETRPTGRGLVGPAVSQYHAVRLSGGTGALLEFRLINRGASNAAPVVRVEAAPLGVVWNWPAGTVMEADGGYRLPPLDAGAGAAWSCQVSVPSAESLALIRVAAGFRSGDNLVVSDRLTAAVTTQLKTPGTELLSVSWAGGPLDRHAEGAGISADGERAIFHTLGDNVIAVDRNEFSDVFLRSRSGLTNAPVSTLRGGALANEWSWSGQLSADGRMAVFTSAANNLGPDADFDADVFVKDLTTGVVELSSRRGSVYGDYNTADGSISVDARWVCFSSYSTTLSLQDTNRSSDVFVVDRSVLGNSPLLISRGPDGTLGNGNSYWPVQSSNGRWVLYSSLATNLSSRADTNQTLDVYLWNAETKLNELISVGTDGTSAKGYSEAVSVSDDGRWVTFSSDAPDLPGGIADGLPHFYLWDRESGVLRAAESWRRDNELDSSPNSLVVSSGGDWLVLMLRREVAVNGSKRIETTLDLIERESGRRIRAAQGARGPGVPPGGFSEVSPAGRRFDGRFLVFNGEGREGRAFVTQAYLYDRAEAEVSLAAGRGGSVPRTVDLEDANLAWRAVQVLVQPGVPAAIQLVLGNPGEFGETMSLTAGALGAVTLELRRADDVGEPVVSLPAKLPVMSGGQVWLKGTLTVPVGAELAAVELTVQSQLNATVWERVRLQPVLDADADGMADEWEQTHFRSLLVAGVDTDQDGDGQTDREEFQAGSDPTKSTEPFRVSLEEVDGKARLRWPVVTDRYYTVQRSESLGQAFELGADGVRWLEGGLAEYAEVPEPNTFYRVEVDLP